MAKNPFDSPEHTGSSAAGKEKLSDCITRWKYSDGSATGDIYAVELFSGIHVWANDLYMSTIPPDEAEDYHFLKINYCTDGRCEVTLAGERYVYLEKGILSIDSNRPVAPFYSPEGRYQGLEILFDLSVLECRYPPVLAECGIHIMDFYKEIEETNGSCLTRVSELWQIKAKKLMEELMNASLAKTDYCFRTIELLYLLRQENRRKLDKRSYLTKGQKVIAEEIEKIVSGNLQKHHIVEQLAQGYGISASSAKKYFETLYGKPISTYLREKRMERAKEMLVSTRISIADIAVAAGYLNQGKFSSAFKAYTGKTPLEYRRLQYDNQRQAVNNYEERKENQ